MPEVVRTSAVASAVVVALAASAYAVQINHSALVSTLERRINALEAQAEIAKSAQANETAQVIGILQRRIALLEVKLERAKDARNETALIDALEASNDAADVRHLRQLLVLSSGSERSSYDSAARYSFARAKQAGFTFEQIWRAADDLSCPPHECLKILREAGFTEVCTTHLGFTVNHMKAHCQHGRASQNMNFQHRTSPCCTEEEIASVLTELRARGESFEAARTAGFSLPEIRLAGYTCEDAHDVIFTESKHYAGDDMAPQVFLQTLQRGRQFCTAEERDGLLLTFKKDGVELEELAQSGYMPEELRRADYSVCSATARTHDEPSVVC